MRGSLGVGLFLLSLCGSAAAQEIETEHPTRSGVLVTPRIGVLPFGSGDLELSCEASGAASGECPSLDSADYQDRSLLGFGVDVLGNLSSNFRLGGGLWFVPMSKVDGEESENGSAPDEDTELGSDLSAFVVAEGLIDLAPRFALAGRLFFGGVLLFPGGDVEDSVDSLEDICEQQPSGFDCDVNGGPYLGPTLGGGVGLIADVSDHLAVRGDALLQWHSLKLLSTEISGAGGSMDMYSTLSGFRLWITAGLEL